MKQIKPKIGSIYKEKIEITRELKSEKPIIEEIYTEWEVIKVYQNCILGKDKFGNLKVFDL